MIENLTPVDAQKLVRDYLCSIPGATARSGLDRPTPGRVPGLGCGTGRRNP